MSAGKPDPHNTGKPDPYNKGGSLKPGDTLNEGDYLVSQNGLYRLQVENNQLVEYGPEGQQIWSKAIGGGSVALDNTGYDWLADGSGNPVDLGNQNNDRADNGVDVYVLQNDGNFVAYDSAKDFSSDNAVDATNKFGKDNIPDPLVAPAGASTGLVAAINSANNRIPPLIKSFGTGSPKLPFTEATGPSASMTTILDNPVLTGSGQAYNAYQSAVSYQNSHEQQWYQNDNDLAKRTGELANKRTTEMDQAYGAVADCNATLRAAAIPNGKPGSIIDETPLLNAVKTAVANVQKYATDYANYGGTLAPANAIWPNGGTGPKDVISPAPAASGPSKPAASGPSKPAAGSSGPGSYNDGYNAGLKAGEAKTTGGGGTGGVGTDTGTVSDAADTTTASSASPSTDYNSLFGTPTDGTTSATGSGSTASTSYESTDGATGTASASDSSSEIASELAQLPSELESANTSSNGETASPDSSLMDSIMMSQLMPHTGTGTDSNNNSGDNSGNGQNSNSSPAQNSSTAQNASATAAPDQTGTAAPAAVTAPATGAAPATTSGTNTRVSVPVDGENQWFSRVVGDAVNTELNNPNGSNAADVYMGTPGENTQQHQWQPIDESQAQTGDIMQWHDRSALVVRDDKGMHIIVDGNLIPVDENTPQNPPQDSFGTYGAYMGFFHPTGLDQDGSTNSSPVETAVTNPPAVTSTQSASTNPPPVTPPTQS